MDTFIVHLVKPFMMFVILVVFAMPVTMAVQRWMRPGRLKTLLLDRTLVERKPWIGWLAMVIGYAVMIGVAWLVLR